VAAAKPVGWVERSETHHLLRSFTAVKKKQPLERKLRRSSTQHCATAEAMGFAALYPSYALFLRWRKRRHKK
jgi:hypothetical protein